MMEDKENRTAHDFLTVSDMDNFNDKVKSVLNKKTEDETETPEPITETSSNTESFVVNPAEIAEDLLYQLSDIIDSKTHFATDDIKENEQEGPASKDKILNSIAVAYINVDNLPIAVALLQDPTIENYQGIIPGDYYELKSGKSLEQRIQQVFFAFKPDMYSSEVGKELKQKLESNSPNLFIVTPSTDETTNRYLIECGYRLVSNFTTEGEQESVNLWIN